MRCFQKRALLFIVVSFLLLQACVDAGAAASSVSTSLSSLVNHGETAAAVHIRKLLTITTDVQAAAAAAAMSADTAEKTAAEEELAPPSECSEDAVEVSQSQDPQPPPGGVGTYCVTIANTCLNCTVSDVHISCGEFGQAQLAVAPADFRRVAVGDCLVRGGGALGPGESVAFSYSSLFQYQLNVASVSCSCS